MPDKKIYAFESIVFIGRFQPFHIGHLKTVEHALSVAKKIILVVGSHLSAPSVRGPWSGEERIQMIKASLSKIQHRRVCFVCVRDKLYDEELWRKNILNEVYKISGTSVSIAIIGHEKDFSSYYLKLFPEWKFIETGNFFSINATNIREKYFLKKNISEISKLVPEGVFCFLKKYKQTKHFEFMQDKFKYIQLKKSTIQKEQVVCNALVFCAGYILFIKNKDPLFQSLYCLPEGFPRPQESFFDCVLRILQNDLALKLSETDLRRFYKKVGMFDYSQRNPICKMISHTFYFELDLSICPEIKLNNKKIDGYEWVLLEDVYLNQNKIAMDFFQIISYFCR